MNKSRFAVASLAMVISLIAGANSARAESPDARSVEKAKAFLGAPARARDIMSYCHMGAPYKGCEFAGVAEVTRAGKPVPGQFALVYDYTWGQDADGETRLAFLCDEAGRVYGVRVQKTNAILQQPFAVADLSIKIFGNVLLEAFKKDLSEKDVARIRDLIDNADSKGMLEVALMLQQAFGK